MPEAPEMTLIVDGTLPLPVGPTGVVAFKTGKEANS